MNRKISRFFGVLVALMMILGLPAIAFAANTGGQGYLYHDWKAYVGSNGPSGNAVYYDDASDGFELVIGGQGPGNASTNNNSVYIAADVLKEVYGGTTVSGDALNNSVTIAAGTIGKRVYGAESVDHGVNLQKVAWNSVEMSGGTVTHDVVGSYCHDGFGYANSVDITGGTVEDNVIGCKGINSEVTQNTVTLAGGTFGGSVYGAMTNESNATGNTVTLSGGTLSGNVYGGQAKNGNATGNTVVLAGGVIGGDVYGGHTEDSGKDSITDNLLRVKGISLQAQSIFNFERMSFTLPEDTAPGDTLLAVQNPVDLARVNISVANRFPAHKKGDRITLISKVACAPKTVSNSWEYEIKVVNNALVLQWLRSSTEPTEPIEPTLEFSSDDHGDIVDWTFRGDADDNRKITEKDVQRIEDYYLNSPNSAGPRQTCNADANADNIIDEKDAALVGKVRNGENELPDKSGSDALTFEVKDVPDDGHKISAVTVNSAELAVPAWGKNAETTANGVTYTVTIDADGNGSVSGKYLAENKIDFQHDACNEDVAASISFSSDKNGTIEDWTFRGDADADREITAVDWEYVKDDLNDVNYPDYHLTTDQQLRNGDADANGHLNPNDWKLIRRVVNEADGYSLPYTGGNKTDALTFEVKDAPNAGYEIAAVTVNGNMMKIPVKGKSATTEADGVTYTVTIDAKGKGSVSGKNLKENVIAFEHTPAVTPRGDDDPTGDKPTEGEFDKKVTATNTDGDLAGSTFGLLKARGVAKGKKNVQIKWTDPQLGAAKYIVYGNKCNSKGKKHAYVKLKEFSAGTYKYIPTDIHGQKLKKGTYYKFLVAAVDKNGRVIAVSKTVHVTTNGGKKGNYKSVKRVKPTKKSKYAIKAGKTKKLKVKAVKAKKKVAKHRATAWEYSNPNVATVSKKGKVTAKGKGTCTIYAYAQNGVYTTFKITVK